jgi:hypothetical protein
LRAAPGFVTARGLDDLKTRSQHLHNGDNSLIGTNPKGVNNSSIDEPDYNGGPIHLGKDPRSNGNKFFDTSSFSLNALGDPGTARRRFFYGPGAQNYDMAVAKNLTFAESRSLLFRVEAINVFNHTQFFGPRPSMATSATRPSARSSTPLRRAFCRALLSSHSEERLICAHKI